MNGTYTDVINSWHDFYILAGGAAATLTGLLFVAVSIHIDMIAHEKAGSLRQIASEILSNYVYIIVIALAIVSPAVSRILLMIVFFVIGIQGVIRITIRTFYIMRVGNEKFKQEVRNPLNGLLRIIIPSACFLSLVISGVLLFLSADNLSTVLSLMMIVILYLLVRAIIDAWSFLIRLAIFKRTRGDMWDQPEIKEARAEQSVPL